MNKRERNAVVAALVVVSLIVVILAGCRDEEPIPRSYNTNVYTEQGGAKLVVASGGEIEVQSGATLDVQSGATTDYSGGVDLDGALLDLDADGDTSLQASTDDQIDIEVSGADDFKITANTFEVLAGSTLVMNGTVLDLDADEDTSLTASTDDQIDVEVGGADVFVLKDFGVASITSSTTKHLFEILDSTNVMTGGTNVLSALNIDMGIGDSTAGTNSVYGILIDTISADAENTETGIKVGSGWDVAADFDAGVTIDGGVTNIGGGSPDVAAGDNDLFVDAVLEVDGEIEADGTVDVDGAMSIDSDLTFGEQSVQTLVAESTISSTGVYIPITSTAAITTDTTTPIEDGTVTGEFIIIVNENASDAITIDGTGGNVECKSNIVLGAGDSVTLMWDGSDWRCISSYDNS